jgi:glycosyltransferase involved in cell wall biosynthesis
MERDFAAMRDAGFTVVRTYTTPPDDLIEVAADSGLRILAGVFYPDWRFLLGSSKRAARRVLTEARNEVRAAARRFANVEQVAALCLGNEVPADVLRWFGTDHIADAIDVLAEAVREEDDGQLVTYANYPTAEYLPLPSLDFLTFNVYLEDENDLRRYLNRLHTLAGDRPLVLGEIGVHVEPGPAGERRQAEFIDAQLKVALERGVAGTCIFSWTDEWWVGDAAVEGWSFGITRGDRSARPAVAAASRWNHASVADLDFDWPSMSVVVCAYNAEETLDECLRHTCALDYPGLEIIVVDDGSTDRTREIALLYPRARLVEIPHAGLSVARNEGFRAATGDVVAYLDSDAYPPPEWPYYLALGLDAPDVGGAGGPNLPPVSASRGAHAVAQAPGGPVHVLVADDRAEHIPGCNMAFWKEQLVELGGFDPVFIVAGDDIDLCWRLLERGRNIGFHPAAMVWHHRRTSLRAYLRQQRGYGRSEALVEARHPNRFTLTGSARWRGRIYNSLVPSFGHQRVYRGAFGGAAYQSVYEGGGHALDIAHQVGVPVATALVLSAPFTIAAPVLGIPAVVGGLGIASLAAIDLVRARPPRRMRDRRLRFRASVAAMQLLQPIVRLWSRVRSRPDARRSLEPRARISGPPTRLPRGVMLVPHEGPRAELAAGVIAEVHRAGIRVLPASGWEDHDGRLLGSMLVAGDLVTSAYPEGFVQVRVKRRPRLVPLLFAAAAGTAWAVSPLIALGVGIAVAADVARGIWRTGPVIRRTLRELAA